MSSHPSGATVPSHAEQFPKHGEEVLAGIDLTLQLHTNIRIIRVPTSLQFCLSKSHEGLESLFIPSLLDKPSRRLRAVVNLDTDDGR